MKPAWMKQNIKRQTGEDNIYPLADVKIEIFKTGNL